MEDFRKFTYDLFDVAENQRLVIIRNKHYGKIAVIYYCRYRFDVLWKTNEHPIIVNRTPISQNHDCIIYVDYKKVMPDGLEHNVRICFHEYCGQLLNDGYDLERCGDLELPDWISYYHAVTNNIETQFNVFEYKLRRRLEDIIEDRRKELREEGDKFIESRKKEIHRIYQEAEALTMQGLKDFINDFKAEHAELEFPA